jgi:hypothetical protein
MVHDLWFGFHPASPSSVSLGRTTFHNFSWLANANRIHAWGLSIDMCPGTSYPIFYFYFPFFFLSFFFLSPHHPAGNGKKKEHRQRCPNQVRASGKRKSTCQTAEREPRKATDIVGWGGGVDWMLCLKNEEKKFAITKLQNQVKCAWGVCAPTGTEY